MDALKLMALDAEDLAIVSAHVQDAVLKVSGLVFEPRRQQLSVIVNRFVWEKAEGRRRSYERRRAALVFKRVRAVRSAGIDREKPEDVLSLLAATFTPHGEGPEGTVNLAFSGGATMALDVECIEVQLADTGGAWETSSLPRHQA
ncbi:Protein of unknown function [Rhizobium sp. RU20A]|uniref:DUF2948 family protein n=1 Tax=Rhizobium sp. RU20A TaxID=1907412 RepID=UPI000955333F|nr:DUF2948 family protein [Rhizobium sp. RU20A]SIQ58509.1 Protein of unknown function [Rhizobium sp. RU20A]